MQKYDPDDMSTFYFVIQNGRDGKRLIKGWTDDKFIAKSYMEFHSCPDFELRKVTKVYREMEKILLNENVNDEIKIYVVRTRNRDKSSDNKTNTMQIGIPMTSSEYMAMNGDLQTFLSGLINYSYAQKAMYYLQDEWQTVLKKIFFFSIANAAVMNKFDNYASVISMDELVSFYRLFRESFGE